MTDHNLETWERFADIDPKFTKPITGKSYRGTSPNPHYVIRCLTEMFGPVGAGFGWEVLQEGFVPLDIEVLHWCRIKFWHGNRDQWFESYGQTKALMKTRNGLMSDEDAPKKSLTDAIVKAASQIGIAANIFLGRWDDQKYVASVNEEFREKEHEDRQEEPGYAPPPTKPNGLPEKGWRADGSRTSFWLKNVGSWDELKRQLDQDVLDCHTLRQLEELKTFYRSKAREQRWNKQFLDALTQEFNAIERSIMERMEVEELADVPLKDALEQSLKMHPINAG